VRMHAKTLRCNLYCVPNRPVVYQILIIDAKNALFNDGADELAA